MNKNKIIYAWILYVFVSFVLPWRNRIYFLWDDVEFLLRLRNPNFQEFFLPHQYQIHPIFNFAYWLQIHLFGVNPRAFLIVSTLFHVFNIFLVFQLIKKLTKSDFLSLLASVFVSFNKSFFTVVFWPSMFSTVLLTTWLLLCSNLLVGLWKKFSNSKMISLFFLLILASFTQGFGVGVGFIFAIAVFLFWKKRREKLTLIWVTGIAGLLPLFIIAPLALREMRQDQIVSFSWLRLFNFMYFVAVGISQTIISRFFLPGFIPNIYSRSNVFVMILLPFVVLSYFTFVILRKFKNGEEKQLLPFFIFGSFTLVPFIIASIGRSKTGALAALAERNMYVPFFFFILALVYSLSLLKSYREHHSLIKFLLIGICIVLSFGHQITMYLSLNQLFL